MVAGVAVVLLDREGQVLADKVLLLGDEPVEALPVVGHEDVALDADPIEKSPAGRIITPTQLPGQGSPCHRVIGFPEPNLVFFPSTKCHISSICTIPLDGAAEGPGVVSTVWWETNRCGPDSPIERLAEYIARERPGAKVIEVGIQRLKSSKVPLIVKPLDADRDLNAAELEELTRAVECSSPVHVEPGEYKTAAA